MTNKELERLFTSKLGNRKVEFDPEAWARMESFLDKKEAAPLWYQQPAVWLKGLTAGIVALFFVYFLSFDIDMSNFENKNPSGESELEESVVTNSPLAPVNQIDNKEETLPPSNQNTDNSIVENSKSDKKKARKKKKEQQRIAHNSSNSNIPNSRFVDVEALSLTGSAEKELPRLESYSEEAIEYYSNVDNSQQTSYMKKASNQSHIGARASMITARNLLVASEGIASSEWTPGWAAGFVLQSELSNTLFMETGISYSGRKASGLSTYENTGFGFGLENMRSEVGYNSLHYIEVPLSIGVSMGLRHKLSGGVYGSYLFAAHAKSTSTISDGVGSTSTTQSVFGNGMIKDPFDFGVIGAYDYLLNERLSLGVETWYGLLDVSYDMDGRGLNKNLQFRFTAKYWIR